MNRNIRLAFALAAAVGTTAAQAGIWQDAFRGLDLIATPSGSPVLTTSDGTRINGARSGRVRIVPNGLGHNGYRLEFDRNFGPDSRGRPETFNFGGLGQLTLSGDTQLTAGYNNLGGKFLTGTAEFLANNLIYTLKTTNGAEDIQLTGTLNVSSNLQINQLGFYTVNLNATNTNSTSTINGVSTNQSQPTNFNIGPIVAQGNIFADAAVSLLAAAGVDTSQFSSIFPKSPADQIAAAIANGQQNTQAAGNAAVVAGATDQNSLAPLVLQTVLGGDQNAAAALTRGLAGGTLVGEPASQTTPTTPLPEPGTLVLLGLGGAVFCRNAVRVAGARR